MWTAMMDLEALVLLKGSSPQQKQTEVKKLGFPESFRGQIIQAKALKRTQQQIKSLLLILKVQL